jgi:hypothetical protein
LVAAVVVVEGVDLNFPHSLEGVVVEGVAYQQSY